ncbi:MAG: hypothetical protein U0359_38450 [Byssovorax sp.]
MRSSRDLVQCLALTAVVSLGGCVEQAPPAPERVESSAAAVQSPGPQAEAFASDVADAMIDRLVALLFREFAVTTAENAAVGSAAISNVFHDDNPTMRLVGDVGPLQDGNLPQDSFEADALAAAKQGQNFSATEKVSGKWYVRKSLAVSVEFSSSCVHCHSNFTNLSNPWVGALMVRARVPD